jgi:hypothetical protein
MFASKEVKQTQDADESILTASTIAKQDNSQTLTVKEEEKKHESNSASPR